MSQTGKAKELFRAIKYFMIAASAGIIEMLVFTLLTEFSGWSYWPCYLIGLVLSVLWNFTMNRRYTFKSNNQVATAMGKVFCYYLVFTPLSTILGNYLVEVRHWNEYLMTILNMLVNGVTEFLYQRFFVFGKTIDTNHLAKKSEIGTIEVEAEHL